MLPPKRHLTPADAVAIYQLRATSANPTLIADRFGVSRRAVYDIWNRVSWVPDTLPYWSAQHRLAYTSGAPPPRTRHALSRDEAVDVYKAKPAVPTRSAARELAATVRYSCSSHLFAYANSDLTHDLTHRIQLGVRPKTVYDVWNHVTWTSATAPYRPAPISPL